MNHKVFINSDNFIEIRACDILTMKIAVDIGYQVLKLASQLEKDNIPTNILIDSTCVKTWSVDAMKMVEIIFKNLEVRKVATFGSNKQVAQTHRKTIANAGKEDIAKVFKTRQEAKNWLMEP